MPSRTPTTDPAGDLQEDSLKHSPLEYISTLFVAFLQGLFQTSPPGAYHWSPDETSEIWITGDEVLRGEQTGQRPAISVTIGPVQFYSLGLDDLESYDPRTGMKRKSVLVPGTVSINCMSRVAAEAKRLGWVCAEQVWLLRELLIGDRRFFDIGQRPTIGAVSAAGSLVASDMGDEWRVVSVNFPFQFQRTSQRTPLGAHIIRNIDMAIRTKLQRVSNAGGAGTGGADPPFQAQGYRPSSFAPHASDAYGNTPRPGEEAPVLLTAPHPLHPSQRVLVRASRPNGPAVRPPAMGGRSIPLSQPRVEESGSPAALQEPDASTFKV